MRRRPTRWAFRLLLTGALLAGCGDDIPSEAPCEEGGECTDGGGSPDAAPPDAPAPADARLRDGGDGDDATVGQCPPAVFGAGVFDGVCWQ